MPTAPSTQHYRCDLRRVSEVGNARLYDLQPRVRHLALDLVANALRHRLARAAQAALVRLSVARGIHIGRNIVGINAHDIAQRAVAL